MLGEFNVVLVVMALVELLILWFFAGGRRSGAAAVVPVATVPGESTELDFAIAGMHCAACVGRVEKAILRAPGVQSAEVSLLAERARVVVSNGKATDIIKSVEAAGYDATPALSGIGERSREAAPTQGAGSPRLPLAAAFTAPVFVMAMGPHVGLIPMGITMHPWWNLVQMVLTVPVLFGAGLEFFKGAAASLRQRTGDMNTLIALGTGAAFGYSTFVTLQAMLGPHAGMATHDVYFETSAVIVTLILTGRTLEARARRTAGDAIRQLLDLQARTAHLIRNGEIVDVPAEEVKPGDRALVKPGEKLPADGVVVHGESTVDESMLTGESMPAERSVGDKVSAGTLNITGSLEFRVTQSGDGTALAQIVRLVERAQSSKAPVQRLADRITEIFVPSVLMVSVLALGLWLFFRPDLGIRHALTACISVLIIACPCALGLATPAAIMVGAGRGARLGVLVKGAEVLEGLNRIDVAAFDKTGTLTEGRPSVTDVLAVGDADAEQGLRLAAALENYSEHPLASAICRADAERAIKRGPEPMLRVTDFRAEAGVGVSGTIAGQRVQVGSASRLAAELSGTGLETVTAIAARLEEAGKTAAVVMVDGKPVAVLGIADTIRPTSARAATRLRNLGIETVMISGDNQRAAEAIARTAGIDRVIAGVQPGQKAAEIELLKSAGKHVAMIGDGINDAPALAAADAGIAVGGGADIAIEAADVVLMRSDLNGVADAIELSGAVMGCIRQNLMFAFGYNILGIPAAAGVFYGLTGHLLNPMIASAAMAMSSFSVVSNALRLRNWQPSSK